MDKSYNDFVNNRIQNIIDITEPITLDDGKYTLKTGKEYLHITNLAGDLNPEYTNNSQN